MFDSQIQQLSTEALDKLFESAPAGSPNADTLTTGKDDGDNGSQHTKEIDPNKDSKITKSSTNFDSLSKIPFYDESLDTPAAPTEEETKAAELKAQQEVEEAEKDTSLTKDDDTKGKDDPKKDSTVQVEAVNEILTNTVDFLIKTGKWVDFEGREDLEITQEVYADLAAKQDEYRLGQLYNELLDSTGDYGKAIYEHIKNGGNPDEIIDLFKEQKQIQQIDTSTEAGKQAKIEKYYSDILGWKPERVEKTVKRLITDDEINSEFTDVEVLYDKYYKEELAKTQEVAKQRDAEDKQRQATFVTNIKTVLKEDSTLTDNDRKLVQSGVLDFKHKLPNGQKVNDFYIKFAEKQADPKEYVDLVRFVMDKENYLKSIKRTEKTQANKDAFNFIKNSTTLTKTKSSPLEINDKSTSAPRGTDFSFALKK